MPTYVAPDGPSELGAKQTRLTWAANSMEAANRVIATKGLLFYPGGGTGADLPVAGNLTRGITALSVAPAASGTPIALGSNDPRGVPIISATIPSNPIDKQLWIYEGADFAWQFIYDAGSSNSHKWLLIGGAPISASVSTAETTTSATYTNLTTAGPSVALPFAGDYMIEIGCRAANSAASTSECSMSYDIGATGAVDADQVKSIAGTSSTTMERTARKNGLSAVTLTTKYKTQSSGSATFLNRFISALPVRVG